VVALLQELAGTSFGNPFFSVAVALVEQQIHPGLVPLVAVVVLVAVVAVRVKTQLLAAAVVVMAQCLSGLGNY
jgi:hypothetical protein